MTGCVGHATVSEWRCRLYLGKRNVKGGKRHEPQRTNHAARLLQLRAVISGGRRQTSDMQITGNTRPHAPVLFIYYHSVELYLKAFLRVHGLSVAFLQNDVGHDFKKLEHMCVDRGLALDDEAKRRPSRRENRKARTVLPA